MTDLRLLLLALAEAEREAKERAAERSGEAKARLVSAEWEISRVRLKVEAVAALEPRPREDLGSS